MWPFSKEVTSSSVPIYDAVLLIDMQTKYIKYLRKGSVNRLLPSQIKVIRQCADLDIPLVILEYINAGPTQPKLMREARRVPRLVVITKQLDNGFSQSELHVQLQEWKSKNLLIAGIHAEYCVFRTAEAALQLGYTIVTSPSLIAGKSNHSKDDRIDWFSKNGSIITI